MSGAGTTPQIEAGACTDPSCPVLHADPANPVHPPFYEPGGPFVDVPEWAKQPTQSGPSEETQ